MKFAKTFKCEGWAQWYYFVSWKDNQTILLRRFTGDEKGNSRCIPVILRFVAKEWKFFEAPVEKDK